jgi:hypothetical protein
MGARYSTGSRDTRPNIYCVSLAESGFGKEHARSQVKRLIAASYGVFDRYGGDLDFMTVARAKASGTPFPAMRKEAKSAEPYVPDRSPDEGQQGRKNEVHRLCEQRRMVLRH